MHGFGMGFGWLLWIIVIIGLVWIVANGFNRQGAESARKEDSSLEILNKRYARGEISTEEFERMKRELSS